jgi:hypothetical protein
VAESNGACGADLSPKQAGNQKAGDYKEDVYADVSTADTWHVSMK